MKIAIFGATGRIGRHLTTWALEGGHDVHALARDPSALGRADGLTVRQGDSLDPGAVSEVVQGADAVLSALGPRGAKVPHLLAGSAANIIDAMDAAGIRRLICVSAAGAFITGDPQANPVFKLILPRLLASAFADTRSMEDLVRSSDLDWTLVRATRLVNKPGTGHYRVTPDYPARGGMKIARADVAHFIGSALTDDEWLRSAPALAY